MGQISIKRMNPLRVVTAWSKSGARGSDLLAIILFGFLSNVLLTIGILLNLNGRESTRKRTNDS